MLGSCDGTPLTGSTDPLNDSNYPNLIKLYNHTTLYILILKHVLV